MKTFEQLSRKELIELTREQIAAYTDIAIAAQGVVRPIETIIDFPDYLKKPDVLPERDVTVYEVDGYTFTDMETATKVAQFIGSLPQVSTDYDWSLGSDIRWVKEICYQTPQVTVNNLYSEAKYEASKERIKQLKDANKATKNNNEEIVETVVNYAAIDEIAYAYRQKVRDAIEFFSKAEKVANDYGMYFAITNNHEQAITTLFTVFGIHDDELKNEVREIVARKAITKDQEVTR